MHTKKKNKVIKRIIGIVAAVILLMTAIVSIILFHYLRKPQVKFAQAMANTIGSCKDSELNKNYGTYDMFQKVIKGDLNLSFSDNSDDTNGKNLEIDMLRSAETNKFLAQTSIDDSSFKLYVNSKTSIIYINDMAVRIQYADNLITNMSNSPLTTVLRLDNETVYAFGSAYENCMRFASNNFKNQNDRNADVIEKTIKYFLDMDGSYEGKKIFSLGDKSEKCKLYSVTFDVNDFYDYLDDCFGTHELDINSVYESLNEYMPDIDTVDNAVAMVHDIKQFADDLLNGENITFYFAIDSDDELVTLYADTENKFSFKLDFTGTDYIAQSYRLSVDIIGDHSKSFIFSKKDITSGDEIGVSYTAEIESDGIIDNIKGGLDVIFSGDTAEIDLNIGNAGWSKKAEISGNKKGESLDFKWKKYGQGSLHIGCDPGKISKPDYTECINPFDTDIISVYKFIKKIVKK